MEPIRYSLRAIVRGALILSLSLSVLAQIPPVLAQIPPAPDASGFPLGRKTPDFPLKALQPALNPRSVFEFRGSLARLSLGVVCASGVDQVTPANTGTNASGNSSGTGTQTITNGANDLGVIAACHGTAITSGTGTSRSIGRSKFAFGVNETFIKGQVAVVCWRTQFGPLQAANLRLFGVRRG